MKGKMEIPEYIYSGKQRLFSILHLPPVGKTDRERGIILCAPIFEEHKYAYPVLVETARKLASQGYYVLRFDYRGCGDSEGNFASFTLSDWIADIEAAISFLASHNVSSIGLIGLRLGGTLALAAGSDHYMVRWRMLWQPIVETARYLEDEMRKKLLISTFTGSRTMCGREELMAELDRTGSVDFNGYLVRKRLYRELRGFDFDGKLHDVKRPLIVINSKRGKGDKSEEWWQRFFQEYHLSGEVTTVDVPPFWNLIGLFDVRELIETTCQYVRQMMGVDTDGGNNHFQAKQTKNSGDSASSH